MACELKDLTNNPLCSDSVKDLKDNAIIMDQYINSQENEVPDRFGVMRITWAGLEFKVNNAIDSAVGAIRLEWQTGLTNIENSTTQSLTEINQAKQDAIDEILEVGGVNVVQTTGQSEEDVMSQKAVSDEIDRIDGELTALQNNIDNIPIINVVNETGQSTTDAISQKAFTDFATSYDYVNMTSQRAIGSTYTNTSIYPIGVAVTLARSGNISALIRVNNVEIGSISFSAGTSSATEYFLFFKVPPGKTYQISSQVATIKNWREYKI